MFCITFWSSLVQMDVEGCLIKYARAHTHTHTHTHAHVHDSCCSFYEIYDTNRRRRLNLGNACYHSGEIFCLPVKLVSLLATGKEKQLLLFLDLGTRWR
jgi:hypothetical protein